MKYKSGMQALIIGLLLMYTNSAISQHLFKKKFELCNRESFALESDSTQAYMENEKLLYHIWESIEEKNKFKIRGELKLQILVDTTGHSCLISIENNTNKRDGIFDFKETIDKTLYFVPPKKKVAVIIAILFDKETAQLKRLGLNAKKGWHILNN